MQIDVNGFVSDAGSGDRPNEDLVLHCDRLVAVFDGASGLGDSLVPDGPTDAKWFVDRLARSVERHWLECFHLPTTLAAAVADVDDAYRAAVGGRVSPEYMAPSAAMAAIAIEDGAFVAYRFGDCGVVREGPEVASKVFDASPLEAMDNQSIELLAKAMRRGMGYADARDSILPALRRHRETMNTPSGYPSLTVDVTCVRNFDRRELDVAAHQRMLLTTDGFSAAYDDYGVIDLAGIFDQPGGPLAATLGMLRSEEYGDPELIVYPRLKPGDDATAVLVTLRNDEKPHA